MKMTILTVLVLSILSSCAQVSSEIEPSQILKYQVKYPYNNKASQSHGTVQKGSLENGKLIPYSGDNFSYFDTTSYLNGRAFVHGKLYHTIIDSYKDVQSAFPEHNFVLMECSNKNGGKIWPHRTHQNGLSVDFGMPLYKSNSHFDSLDLIGPSHYFLEFDDDGRWIENKKVNINFEIVAKHILTLQKVGKEQGINVKKVIIKTELKDDLFAGKYGKKLQTSGIYVVKRLEPLINRLHDDHYHIDFEIMK